MLLKMLKVSKGPRRELSGFLLRHVAVSLDLTGQGIKEALVAVAISHVRTEIIGTSGLFICTTARFPDEVDWYSRLGFRRLGASSRRLVLRI
jgi:N-acetylglutamate synthase-like GNAT family acetyltransferase